MLNKLRELQLCEFDILNEFVKVCERKNLRYYLAGGTLLGAVRHKGFIPWDDDIDVVMPRKDYDQFARIASKELDPKYFYQNPDTDPYYFLSYAKIRRNGTAVYEERFKDAKFHKGVFIDIFPLDPCPRPGPVCHFLFNIFAVMNRRGAEDSGEKCKPYKELIGRLSHASLKVLSPRMLVKFRKCLLHLSDRISHGDYVANYAGAYGYPKELFPIKWYEKTKLSFEGRDFLAPVSFDSLLCRNYGNAYMDIPPEDERKWHILEADI